VAPPRYEWPPALRRARKVAFWLLGLQFIAFCVLSSVLTHHFTLTWDFAAYQQAASLIGQGHLNPYSTVLQTSFVRNDYEFLIWLVAPFQRLWPHPMTLKVIQALALVGAEVVALNWIADIAAVRAKVDGEARMSVALFALGTLLLVVNPWIVWTVAFDFHMEPFVTLFSLCTAREFFRGRRRAWLWLALTLTCGAAAVVYIAALAIGLMLNGRRWLRQGFLIIAIGVVWTLGLQMLLGSNAQGLGVYSYILTGNAYVTPKHLSGGIVISAMLKHPGRDWAVLSGNALNIWSNLSPAGFLGLLWLPLAIPIVFITLLSGLTAFVGGFSAPGFQNVALELMVSIGTIGICSALVGRFAKRRPWLVRSVLGLVAINAIVWGAIWLPQTGQRWSPNNPSKTAATLSKLRAEMRPGDEVVVGNGIAGAFAEDRESLYVYRFATVNFPVRSRRVWVIFSPTIGIEIKASINKIYADIAAMADRPGYRLVTDANGIWAFLWDPANRADTVDIGPSQTDALTQPSAAKRVTSVWMTSGPSGSAVRHGTPASWYVTSTGKAGYVVAHDYTRVPVGDYSANVSLSASGAAKVELWDVTTSTLLERRSLTHTRGRVNVHLSARLTKTPGSSVFSGWGPWSFRPVQPPPGDSLEVRVWQPGGKDRVRVYSALITRTSKLS
jgi:uncharacterized membrane protein